MSKNLVQDPGVLYMSMYKNRVMNHMYPQKGKLKQCKNDRDIN